MNDNHKTDAHAARVQGNNKLDNPLRNLPSGDYVLNAEYRKKGHMNSDHDLHNPHRHAYSITPCLDSQSDVETNSRNVCDAADVISVCPNQSLLVEQTPARSEADEISVTAEVSEDGPKRGQSAVKLSSGSLAVLSAIDKRTYNDNLYLANLSSSCSSDWSLLNSSSTPSQQQKTLQDRSTSKTTNSRLSVASKRLGRSYSGGKRTKPQQKLGEHCLDLSTLSDFDISVGEPKMTKSNLEMSEDDAPGSGDTTSPSRSSPVESVEVSEAEERQNTEISSNLTPSQNEIMEDPWVRAPSLGPNTSPRVRFVTNGIQPTAQAFQDSEANQITSPEAEAYLVDEAPFNTQSSISKTDSQEELDRIGTEQVLAAPSCELSSAPQRSFTDRIRNDLDLLSRPSWCDAKFALSRVDQGKATGSRYALRLRAFIHKFLFALGCLIQRNAFTVCFVGLLLLAACCIGLKTWHMETNIEKLWVETGGQLESEMNYKASIIPPSSSSSSGSSGSESSDSFSMQMLIQTGQDAATIDAFKYHLEAAMEATKVTVYMYNQTWRFDDVCYKQSITLGSDNGNFFAAMLDKLIPCFVISPLDCFWDGSKILGPDVPIKTIHGVPDITWKTLDPQDLLDTIINALTGSSLLNDIKKYRDLMVQAGITRGYMNRWCLDPFDKECPETAPNYKKQLPDVKAILARGCNGFATKVMQWPLDLIVGAIEYNSEGNITNAKGLQTLIQLMGTSNMFDFHKLSFKTYAIDWNEQKAKEILYAWQRKFVDKMYKLNENKKQNDNPQTLNAFTGATAEDILLKFSNISVIRLLGGYLLMMGYACLSLMRARASTSQGAVGLFGVVLVALSVAAGLGISSVIGISFNAASTQVLPFLMLGLGVDDMFLMAHHFGEIAVLSYIPFHERTGECLKRVGVSVILTSLAILSGFLFSLIIPMPALRAFGIQAAIVTVFNLISVLVIFPAVLSLDLRRRKDNRLDLLFCFKSSATNEVVDLTENRRLPPHACAHCSHHSCHQNGSAPNTQGGQRRIATETRYQEPPAATITVHNTIQAYANESYVTVLGPSNTSTTFNTPSGPESRTRAPSPNQGTPATPPPQYSVSDEHAGSAPPPRPKVAFLDANSSAARQESRGGERLYTPRSTRITPAGSTRTLRSNGNSNPPTNLTTPMESVRSSTHSLVPKRRGKKPSMLCCGPAKRSGSLYAKLAVLPSLTLNQLGERYYAPFLLKNPVRITILALFGALLGASIYGATQIKDGLDFGDVLPRGTRERQAVVAQTTYFSFYNMYIVTKEFDYATQQQNLYLLHEQVGNISYVMKQTDGSVMKFWLQYFRDYLQGLQDSFDKDWSKGLVNASTWQPTASDNTVLAYKLLVQTGRIEDPTDSARIGCSVGTNCNRIDRVRLVSDDGVIREDAFYNYLSVWYSNDPLAYAAAQAQIYPTPSSSVQERDANLIIPPSSGIKFAQMPFYLNNMRDNEDFVYVIKNVRRICETMESETDVASYPSGYPFTFWQQYIDLRYWLFLSLASVIGAVFIVLSLVLFNPWASAIMAVFLAMIATELLGFMGWVGVKLSAVPAVILVASIGLGVEFTVHITFAYITSCGTRNERVARSIGHMLGPVVDGSISTLLGVIMLAGSEFDFIIKYFFHVLGILILLGVINGLILLPVVLSLIGPPAEVIPVGGGARLKTPTPPPSPPCEEECFCHHCGVARSRVNTNHSSNVCHCARCTESRRRCIRHDHVTSRDDLNVRHQSNYAGRQGRNTAPYGHRFEHRDTAGAFRRVRGGQMPRSGQHHHPYSIPPIYEETEPSVFVHPRNDYVLYSREDARPSNNDHCESVSSQFEFHPIHPDRDRPAAAPESSYRDRRQHIATLSSSVTVNLHTPVAGSSSRSFCEHSSSSGDWQQSRSGSRLHCETGPLEQGTSPHRRFDISALNKVHS